MSDEPTASGGGPTPDQPNGDRGPDGDLSGGAPPNGDPYNWHGPAGPYQAPGAHSPYGAPYGPYQPPTGYYGPPQGPYTSTQQAPAYSWPYAPPPPPRPPLSPADRRRRTRRALALSGALLLAVGAGIGIGAAIAPTSPSAVASSIVSRAIAASNDAATYHYVEKSTTFGAPDDIAGDATPNGGRQVILQRCTGGTTYFHLRLVDGVVYFKGTRLAMVDQLGVPASRAASTAGQWVKVVKGDKPYHTFAEGITTGSNAAELRTAIVPTSSRVVPGSSPASTEVVGALSKTKKTKELIGTAALVVDSSSGLPRTLRATATSTNGRISIDWTFSKFGEKVQVPAPSHTLAYASLHATPPPAHTCS